MNLSVHDSMAQHYAAVRRRLMGKPKVAIHKQIDAVKAIEVVKERNPYIIAINEELEKAATKYKVDKRELETGALNFKSYMAKAEAIYNCSDVIKVHGHHIQKKIIAKYFGFTTFEVFQAVRFHKQRKTTANHLVKWRYMCKQKNKIISDVCKKYGVTLCDIMSNKKLQLFVDARHEAYYRIKKEATRNGKKLSYSEVSRIFSKHHTTVMHGVIRHKKTLGSV